jgi:hypothetical protein
MTVDYLEKDDFNLTMLSLLEKKIIEVRICNKWVTGNDALKYSYKELILNNPEYRMIEIEVEEK